MRLVIALFVVGLCAPIVGSAGTADAQVWKVKKGKPGAKPAAAKTTKAKPTRTARPTMKKKSRPATRPKVQLVPDEDETATERDAGDRTNDRDRDRDRDDDAPIVIHVEEID